MPRQYRDHDLMHRKDHRARGAAARDYVTCVDRVGDAGAFASQSHRDHHAEQALISRRLNRLDRKSRFAVDGVGVRQRYGCGNFSAGIQIVRRLREVSRYY
jgi:hypothetical protein